MAWCHQATSHYLTQCWPRSVSPHGIPRPQWVNTCNLSFQLQISVEPSKEPLCNTHLMSPSLVKSPLGISCLFTWSLPDSEHNAKIMRYLAIRPAPEYTASGSTVHRGGWWAGPRFNIKMLSYQYRKFHCGDKTIVWSSYLHNGVSYTGKMTSLYWIRVQILLPFVVTHPCWYNISLSRSNALLQVPDSYKYSTHTVIIGPADVLALPT